MADRPENTMASHIEKITLGIGKILESSPGVTEVKFEEKPPAERHVIVSWEQKHSCVLPEDLRNFYLMTDGFQMSWAVKAEDNAIQVGSMVIHSISNLVELSGSSTHSLPDSPTLVDLDDEVEEEGRLELPRFDSRHAIFELDPCNGSGKVCLVYTMPEAGHASNDPAIWFLDRALYWHMLTDTFTAYYRLLLCHLGLPQWHYAFTSYGLSPQAKQWMNMYKPITFNPSLLTEESDYFIKLDPNKIFKSKNKTPVTKKKLPAPPTGYQKAAVPTSKHPAPPGATSRK